MKDLSMRGGNVHLGAHVTSGIAKLVLDLDMAFRIETRLEEKDTPRYPSVAPAIRAFSLRWYGH